VIREDPIAVIKAELATALHRLGEQQRSQAARETSGNGPLEEDPNVCPVSGTRAFDRRGYAEDEGCNRSAARGRSDRPVVRKTSRWWSDHAYDWGT
jgi:hypothetical protein